MRTAMATQTREQGRYLGGRPPYGYRLADAGPHPNKVHAAWGRRAYKLEPDPATAPIVAWMFAQRLAGHSVARITRALNDAGIPFPSAADPARNPHRAGTAWTLRTVAATLANPRYEPAGVEPAAYRFRPGRPGQYRAGASAGTAVEPARGLGHLPQATPRAGRRGRTLSPPRTPPPRGPAGSAVRRYLLAGLLACGQCGRRLESAWSNGKPAYRCRHGYTSAARPDSGRPKNTYIREDQILPHLAALAILLGGDDRTLPDGTLQVTAPGETAGLIDQLRTAGITLTYDPDTRTIRTGGRDSVGVTVGLP